MKRLTILSLVLVFYLGLITSCSKKCKGGGWYGNRNLGYVPAEKKIDKAKELAVINTEETGCQGITD